MGMTHLGGSATAPTLLTPLNLKIGGANQGIIVIKPV
jgi:hypothetical protein